MTIEASRADEWRDLRPLATMVVLVGAALNGLAVHAVRASAGEGGGGLLLGVSPFDLVALVAGGYLVWQGRAGLPRPTGWFEAGALLALLVPSSSVAWIAVALYAGVLALRTEGAIRLGACLFVALAASSLWAAVGVPALQAPIGALEATVVGFFAGFVWEGATVAAHHITAGFTVILLPACTTAVLLPRALLALTAVVALLGGGLDRRFLAGAMALGIGLALANWARLAGMTGSADHYELLHGPIGANLFDALQTLGVLAIATWIIGSRRHET